MAISLKDLKNKVNPASADVGGEKIDSQWLEPASYDKKVVKAAFDSPHDVFDKEDLNKTSDNFTVQDKIKKNTKAPLREMTGEACATDEPNDSGAVNSAYEDESLTLLEEIMDIIEDLPEDASYCRWKDVSSNLKYARDILLRSLPVVEEELNEDFKVGSYKLRDGSKVILTKEDVKLIKNALSGTAPANKDKLVEDFSKNPKEFKQFIEFAKNLKEDYHDTLDELLEGASDEQLSYIVENNLSEGEVWDHIKGGAKAGARVGAVVGAVYGGTAGGAVGIAKKVRQLHKAKSKDLVREDENNEKESILGTSAPAMDSDPNTDKKKKEDLQESDGYQKWPNQKKKKFFQGPKDKDGKTETQKYLERKKAGLSELDFERDTQRYKTASRDEKIALEKKWGERASYFREEAEDLQEISAKTLNSYIDGAIHDQMSASISKSSGLIKNNKKFGSTKEIRDFINKRQRGIDKAEQSLERKEAINKLYTKLGLTKKGKEDLQESGGLGGHPANYRTPHVRRDMPPTESGKKLDYYIITPHDVIGSAPKKEGDTFTVRVDKNTTTKMSLIKTVDNRFYGKPLKEDIDLQEISKGKTEKYLDKAVSDHGHAVFAKRNESHPSFQRYWAKKAEKRKKGISLAVNKLDKLNEETEKFTVSKFDYTANKWIEVGKFDSIEAAKTSSKDLLGKNHGNQVRITDSQGRRIKK